MPLVHDQAPEEAEGGETIETVATAVVPWSLNNIHRPPDPAPEPSGQKGQARRYRQDPEDVKTCLDGRKVSCEKGHCEIFSNRGGKKKNRSR